MSIFDCSDIKKCVHSSRESSKRSPPETEARGSMAGLGTHMMVIIEEKTHKTLYSIILGTKYFFAQRQFHSTDTKAMRFS